MSAYLAVAFAALFAAGLTLYSGFGLGTLLLPVFALFYPIEVAVAATAIVHGANNMFKVSLVGKTGTNSRRRLGACESSPGEVASRKVPATDSTLFLTASRPA